MGFPTLYTSTMNKSIDYVREVKSHIDQTVEWKSFDHGRQHGYKLAKEKADTPSDVYLILHETGKWYDLLSEEEHEKVKWTQGFERGIEKAETNGHI